MFTFKIFEKSFLRDLIYFWNQIVSFGQTINILEFLLNVPHSTELQSTRKRGFSFRIKIYIIKIWKKFVNIFFKYKYHTWIQHNTGTTWPAWKLSFLKNLIFNIQKISCALNFLGLCWKLAQIFINKLSENWSTRFPNFHTVLQWYQNISDLNEKKFFNILMWKKYF